MSFTRSLCVLCAVSLFSGAICVALGMTRKPQAGRISYAALIVNEAVSDREIRGRVGETLISESSQWVFLDDFGSLARIPLDEYESRVLPFDPRDDGYARKLRSFFVRGGRRFLFLPLGAGFSGRNAEKHIAARLGEIPFSLEFLGTGQPRGVFLVIFCAASLALFFFRFLPARRKIETADLAFGLPALIFFAFHGAAGFVLCALLVGLAALLREPLREFFRYRGRDFAGKNSGLSGAARECFARDIYEPFRLNLFLAVFFIAGFIAVLLIAGISPLFSAGIFLVFAFIFGLSVKVFSLPRDSQGHIRFVPVSIVRPSLSPVFAAVMLPFALAVCAAVLSAAVMPASGSAENLSSLEGNLVTEDEYQAHAAFQASFSFTPLGKNPGGDYLSYIRAADGLVDPAGTAAPPAHRVPPFPLRELMDFLAFLKGDKDSDAFVTLGKGG